jgi:hypothetical protein
MSVSAQDVFLTAEGADQHKQRGFWQVEIRKQRPDYFEFETPFDIWINEKVRRRGSCDDDSPTRPNRVFETPDCSGANSDDSPRFAESLVDGGSGGGRYGVGLRVEFVILDTLDADRLKCSQTDVQCYVGGLDPALANAIENLRCEVKARGGGRDRTELFGINGLVALAIARRIRPRDIGRKRDVADAIKDGEEIVLVRKDRLETDAALAKF